MFKGEREREREKKNISIKCTHKLLYVDLAINKKITMKINYYFYAYYNTFVFIRKHKNERYAYRLYKYKCKKIQKNLFLNFTYILCMRKNQALRFLYRLLQTRY